MPDRALLSVFTPSRTRPEDLEAILVQRQDLLDDAISRVRESATTDNKHHLLFVGRRGTGKTHLVTLLVHRLGLEKKLNKDLRIAWLNEDETSTTLLELLRRIYLALTKRYPEEYSEESLELMFDLGQDEAERWLSQKLLKSLKDHTLLVVVENLDALFQGLGKAGQQKLRAFIQENPVLSLVATAQRLVDDLTKRTSAFFGFFQTEQLNPLSVKQAAELIGKISTLNGQAEIATFLHSATGRSRVRALHHLSGGNHRIYLVLSQFITRESIDDLVMPFSKMIDEMTPYYQEKVRWLPPQQRKIVEYLCAQERPTSVKDMARQLFASHQSISSQLNDLRKKGYVQAAQRGRESLYQIAEPLMRICIEIKENQTHEPLRMLVDFLRVWYDGRELSSRLGECNLGSLAYSYSEYAIEKNALQGNLRAKLLVDGFGAELSDERGAKWDHLIEVCAQESEELALACGELAKGNDDQALKIFEEIAEENSGYSTMARSHALKLAADTYYKKGDLEKAIADFNAIIDMKGASTEEVSHALYNLGVAHGALGETENEITDYSAVINLVGAPVEQVMLSLHNRGIAYLVLDEIKKSNKDFEAVIKLEDAPIPLRVDSYILLAATHINHGRWNPAITAITHGLTAGRRPARPYLGSASHVIRSFFEVTLTPKIRRNRIKELIQTYNANGAISQLSEALTSHLGELYKCKHELSISNDLESWVSGWEKAGKEIDGLRLPLRIFRTGVDFLKSGGDDHGILLNLNQEERKILEQVLDLDSAV